MADFAMIAGTSGDRRRGDEPGSQAAGEKAKPSAEDAKSSSGNSIYSFFVNIVDEQFRFPLFGFVNIARGNHELPQFGFINWNTGHFSSMQASFVNTTGGNFKGFQAGFINTTGGDIIGVQSGFVNTIAGDLKGLQTGFINTAAGDTKGLQDGFINTTRSFYGAQIGFINTAAKGGQGLQMGFVNASMQKLKGTQIGFINYVDSIEDGIPIGFISIVRNGGYRALEYSFSEFYPFNAGIKLGVERFYTTIYAAYKSVNETSWEHFATGLGMGSIIPIASAFFINPELIYYTSPTKDVNQQLTSFVPSFGFKFGNYFSISAGPSVTWVKAYKDNTLLKPLFHIYEHTINDRNSIVVGVRAAVRLLF